MSKIDLVPFFGERHGEISAYLSFLQNVEDAAREGAPRFRGTDAPITTEQKKILNSSLYLQLYNLVEATMLRCLDAIVAAVEEAGHRPSDLSDELRKEWVRSTARTHSDLAPDKRLDAALDLCEKILTQVPVTDFVIERGGGGNWDDSSIERISERVGCGLKFSKPVLSAVKRPVRDDMGALKLVRDRRNALAHGSLSFVDCSDGVTVSELRDLVDAVGDYLAEAVECFVRFIEAEIVNKGSQVLLKGMVAS